MNRRTVCCVIGCNKTRDDVRFHQLPANRKRLHVWLKYLHDSEITDPKILKKLYRLNVCQKHFEKRFIIPETSLLRANAYPSLFTPNEILTGVPEKPFEDDEIVNPMVDHCYIKKPHIDHTYSYSIDDGHSIPAVFKVALVQLAVTTQKNVNILEAVKQIHHAQELGAQMVVLPECFNSPYGTQYFKEYAEEVPDGETSQALSKAASDTGMYIVGGSVPEKCGTELYNTCTVWNNCGDLIAKHRKMHLFDIDVPGKIRFKESEVLTAGDQITTFEFRDMKIGVGICYDLRFHELAHVMAQQGCSMLIYPGAFNMTTGPAHWELLARARAVDQQLYVALVSPARDPNASYVAWGHSCLVDPWGKVISQLDHEPGIVLGEVDLKAVEEIRSSIPIRSQRRTDIYETSTKDK